MISREHLLLVCAGMLDRLGGTYTMTAVDADRIGDVNLTIQFDPKRDAFTAGFLSYDEARLARTRPDGTS